MASYENVEGLRKETNEIKAEYESTSSAVSNQIYGAIILEPTIQGKTAEFQQMDDLDDFWLNLAKGNSRIESSNSKIPEHDTAFIAGSDRKFSSTRPNNSPKSITSSLNDGFVDTSWEFSSSKTNDGGNECGFPSSDSLCPPPLSASSLRFSSPPNTSADTVVHHPDTNPIDYVIDSTVVDENTKYDSCAKQRQFSSKSNTISGFAHNYASVDENIMKTYTLDNKQNATTTPLRPNKISDSMENLYELEQTIDAPRLSFVEIENDHGSPQRATNNDEPLYAKVIVKKSETSTASVDADEFYSLASARIYEQTTESTNDDNLTQSQGLDYTYATVNKPKRYLNWPMSDSIKKNLQNPPEHTFIADVKTELIYDEIDPNHYSGIYNTTNDLTDQTPPTQRNFPIENDADDVTFQQSVEKPKSNLKTKMKGLISNVKNKIPSATRRDKSFFYPFSFIFNFQIKDNAPVKSILPSIDGKCWLICEKDLKIRLYDAQGLETESIYIGVEGEDLAYDNSGQLYVSCKDTKRIFKIDTRNLCMITTFVDCKFYPNGLAFDSYDNTLIVCQNQGNRGMSIGVAPSECLQKYLTVDPSVKRNLTNERMFSHPTRVVRNANSDILVSDMETKSISIMNLNGHLKSKFAGNDVFTLCSDYCFVCDLQSNIIILSQEKTAGKAHDNVCLLDGNGVLIDTFCVEEIKGQILNAMAISDLGFLWVGGQNGVFIFDYDIY